MLEDELEQSPQPQHHDRMPVGPVTESSEERLAVVFARGDHVDIAQASEAQIAGVGVVVGMSSAPIVVWRHRQDTEPKPDTIRRLLGLQERSVTAVVLDHEESQEKCRRGDGQRQGEPVTERQGPVRGVPAEKEGRSRSEELDYAPADICTSIRTQDLTPSP